jgi:Zn-dependent protease
MFMWLGFINIALAMFNMILGFPLDGECVLRAVVGWITGDATVLLAEQVSSCWHFCVSLLARDLGGLWIAFIG